MGWTCILKEHTSLYLYAHSVHIGFNMVISINKINITIPDHFNNGFYYTFNRTHPLLAPLIIFSFDFGNTKIECFLLFFPQTVYYKTCFKCCLHNLLLNVIHIIIILFYFLHAHCILEGGGIYLYKSLSIILYIYW